MNQDQQQNGNKDENPAWMEDERYKNLDPRMVETIEGEIMEK
jgi:hypothetical protein